MVVFTCQNCGESLQKPKVEKHYYSKCRNRDVNLTCVDCLKDFFGQEYISHNKCVNELQRYSAHGTVFKEQKGEKKQSQYVEMIPNLLNSKDLTTSQRKLLTIISKHENVPRKRQKFLNFSKNVCSKCSPSAEDLDTIFNLLSSIWNNVISSNANKDNISNNKTSIISNDKNSKKENKTPEEMIGNRAVDNAESNTNEKKKIKSKLSSKDKDNSKESEDCAGPEEETKGNVNKLSKKELKKQKKYEKYLAEIENETRTTEADESMELGENESEHHKKRIKKSKKSKTEQSDSNSIVQENGNESVNEKKDISEQKENKKNKKRKLEEPICDVNKKKIKEATTEGDESISQGTFDWADVITRALESHPDKELSLKRLGKKVIDEYQTVKSDHRTYEDLLAKFNKKVKKTRGVKVLKDKAKLVQEC